MVTFRLHLLGIILLLLACFCASQYPPPVTDDPTIITIPSPVDVNITIKFKQPPVGTCTTAFASQKQYTGYINLPPHQLAPVRSDYDINTFFWFIEARTNPSRAPLTVFLNGGPGSSSMVGLFLENGPCEVVEIAEGQFGTQVRDWGWDRSSNVLYIDQPNQAGFSYDKLTNGSLNLLSFNNSITFPPSDVPLGQPSNTFLNGTFSSGDVKATTNTTATAANAMWHFLQGFLGAFPQYNPGTSPNSTTAGIVGINLFAESYGGKYGPAFAAHFERQNSLRKNGSIPRNKTLEIRLASLGIMQGCVDDLIQGPYYPRFANNNTYEIQAMSIVDQENAASSFLSADGCQQQTQACRNAVKSMDPENQGDVSSVNAICSNAQLDCSQKVVGPFTTSQRDIYDITQMRPDPFPPSTYREYLNTAVVQAAIGAKVNYTESSESVGSAFFSTGDYARGGQIEDLAYLLSIGVRVGFVYGDRDYICNWLGGEAISFSVAAQSPSHSGFFSAGYAAIVVNNTYVGGAVRQYGNLSFSRVYDAGHLIPAYQPETAFTVFTRIISGTSLTTGEQIDRSVYGTTGTANATYVNDSPKALKPRCWIRNINATCTEEQLETIKAGKGALVNGILYNNPDDWKAPESSVIGEAGYPGTVPMIMTAASTPVLSGEGSPTTTEVLTGAFVATATPSTTKRGIGCKSKALRQGNWLAGLMALVVLLV